MWNAQCLCQNNRVINDINLKSSEKNLIVNMYLKIQS